MTARREDALPRYTGPQVASVVITALLLLIRLADDYVSVLLFGGTVPASFSYWYAAVTSVSMATLLWLNRRDLSRLNVDKTFVFLVVFSSLLLFSGLPESAGIPVGFFIGGATIFVAWAALSGRLCFGQSPRWGWSVWLLVLASVLPLLPLLLLAILKGAHAGSISFQTFLAAFLQANLPGVVFEEFLFRGMIWMCLRDFGLKDGVIVCVQAILFWISHHVFLATGAGYGFWVALPLIGVLFGILVWRSRSLTPSTISHLLYNFTLNLLSAVFR